MIFVDGGNPKGFLAPSTKITLAEKRRRELIADVGYLQDDGLIFSNNLSYTRCRWVTKPEKLPPTCNKHIED